MVQDGYDHILKLVTPDEEQYATFFHAFDLADAKEFDQLVDHLRTHGTKFYVEDERLLEHVVVGGIGAIEAIDFLVEAGASKRDVMVYAAARGHVELLQVLYERGWHIVDGLDWCRLLFHATKSCCTATNALKLMRWVLDWVLDDDDEKHHCNGDEEHYFGMVFNNTLQNEYIDAAAFLLDNHTAFGLPDWSPDKEEEIQNAANEGSTKSLDFLCQRWGEEFVTSTVRQALRVDFEPDHEDDIKKWLNKRTR